ncbi:MAG: cytochrome c biogenesis protein ResB [Candidatus Omnitrophota bacterium]|nr:cytochrome c biogenesis protein ResB [Candidatus Omnitrophota bacterium]
MLIKQAKIWKFISSLKLAIWLLGIIALVSLIGTLIPQNEEEVSVYQSWWFILLIILFALNLSACLLSRLSLKNRPLGTLICHFSVLVILLGALIGMLFGQKGYLKLSRQEKANSFMASESKEVNLGFSIRLDDFIYNENIDPKEKLLIYSIQNDAVCQMDGASHKNGEEGLIAKIPTDPGTEREISATGYKIKVLRYLPDFVMDIATKKVTSRSSQANNPAIEVELRDKNGARESFWVFARYPDIHQSKTPNFNFVYHWEMRRPKDFISRVTIIKDGLEVLKKEIRVNFPLQFGGYSFFQSSYDPENLNWTGLTVVRDPGVSLVYLGFGLFILGLCIRFYINPFFKTLKK